MRTSTLPILGHSQDRHTYSSPLSQILSYYDIVYGSYVSALNEGNVIIIADDIHACTKRDR